MSHSKSHMDKLLVKITPPFPVSRVWCQILWHETGATLGEKSTNEDRSFGMASEWLILSHKIIFLIVKFMAFPQASFLSQLMLMLEESFPWYNRSLPLRCIGIGKWPLHWSSTLPSQPGHHCKRASGSKEILLKPSQMQSCPEPSLGEEFRELEFRDHLNEIMANKAQTRISSRGQRNWRLVAVLYVQYVVPWQAKIGYF